MTNESTRPETTAGELTAGQHIIVRGTTETPCHVDHVHPVRHLRQVMLLLTEVGRGHAVPFTRLWPAGATVLLATDADLAEVEVAARRARLVEALRELADDIEDEQLPLPTYRAEFTLVSEGRSVVGRWADHLGVTVRTVGDISTARRESRVLEIVVQGDSGPDVVPLDVAAGVERVEAVQAEVDAAALVDGITTLLDSAGESTEGAEHAHAGGVIGGPGENSAECACGTTVSGFDSQAEALAELDRHIANPQGTEATSDGAR